MRSLGDQVQVGPKLVRSNQVVNPMRGYEEEKVRRRWSQEFFNCTLMWAHGIWWLFSDLNVFKSRGRLLWLWLEYVVKIDEAPEVEEWTSTKSSRWRESNGSNLL